VKCWPPAPAHDVRRDHKGFSPKRPTPPGWRTAEAASSPFSGRERGAFNGGISESISCFQTARISARMTPARAAASAGGAAAWGSVGWGRSGVPSLQPPTTADRAFRGRVDGPETNKPLEIRGLSHRLLLRVSCQALSPRRRKYIRANGKGLQVYIQQYVTLPASLKQGRASLCAAEQAAASLRHILYHTRPPFQLALTSSIRAPQASLLNRFEGDRYARPVFFPRQPCHNRFQAT
jgi:hypothetical protein